MFKFLKEKIKSLLKRKKEELEEQEEKVEKAERVEKIEEKKAEKVEVEKQVKKEKKEKEEREEKEEPKLGRLFKIKIEEKHFNEFFEELKLVLLQSNVAYEVVDFIETTLKNQVIGKAINRREFESFMEDNLKKVIKKLFVEPFDLIKFIQAKEERKPVVIVFFGINGSGKTTSIAKVAYLLKQKGIKSVLAASDTFRAASIEQLEKHGEKLGISVIKHKYGADPAAVAFDAISYAKAHAIDVVLIDTSGRMHTEKNLMEEMKKICRVAKPHLKIFVGESIVGNDVIEQGKAFNEEVGIDAIILTKADVDEKGGAALSISYVTKKPILFLGTGQQYHNLEAFDIEKVLEKILD
ncbi:MAG: signal recognition particle-docking protein FtsY [Candidatus Pacearchaeota archaeon]